MGLSKDIQIEMISILKDNYVPVIIYKNSSACLVDPGDSQPVQRYLSDRDLNLDAILITHHHPDHIGGVRELLELHPKARLIVPNDKDFNGNDSFSLRIFNDQLSLDCIKTPGHTLDHAVYYCRDLDSLFCGDLVFGLGCGRVFEGTMAQMFSSLEKVKKLPPTTKIYCAHEYTEHNLKFILENLDQLCLENPASFKEYQQNLYSLRHRGLPSVPLLLAEELINNPFLSAKTVEEFTFWRRLKG